MIRRIRNWLQPRLLILIDRDAFERAAKYDRYATRMRMLGADPDGGLRIAIMWATAFDPTDGHSARGVW